MNGIKPLTLRQTKLFCAIRPPKSALLIGKVMYMKKSKSSETQRIPAVRRIMKLQTHRFPTNWVLIFKLASAVVLLAYAASASAQTYHLTDLGTIGGSQSVANAINASGQVVGYSLTSGGDTHAFLYSG